MFKNLCIYRLPKSRARDMVLIEELLMARELPGCSATDARSIGWVPPCADGSFVHVVNHQILLALGVEQKLLPTAVVKQFAADKAKTIEEAEGRRVGRKEMREICEAATQELLPRAFVSRRRTFGWIDTVNGWLVIDAVTSAKAEEFLEHLRKSVEGLPAKFLKVKKTPASAMTGWVIRGDAPNGFTLDKDLDLCSAEHAQVRYVKQNLDVDEVRQQIASGKSATKLAMTWNDRISFVLTENLQVKRLTFLDILKEQNDGQAENKEERFDLDFALMAGEMARLLGDLVEALGGELAEVAA